MKLLAHRGFWQEKEEQNSLIALQKSFEMGLGIETDLRDRGGGVALCHDAFGSNSPTLDALFALYQSHSYQFTLALNIKADGLQSALKTLLEKYSISNYFVFDMSVPDALSYLRQGLRVFTRQSELEKEPSFYEEACGVWLDEFFGHWVDEGTILRHLEHKKQVAIVSPDLHGRGFQKEWERYKIFEQKYGPCEDLMLCTDKITQAQDFFNA